ncbi:hypothetical protein, partial [Pseudomonas sp.]|uniref:hypothetical protein n=1 Tax=Pseudomonas sp. TaxID=306 RepID=UPI00405441E2
GGWLSASRFKRCSYSMNSGCIKKRLTRQLPCKTPLYAPQLKPKDSTKGFNAFETIFGSLCLLACSTSIAQQYRAKSFFEGLKACSRYRFF